MTLPIFTFECAHILLRRWCFKHVAVHVSCAAPSRVSSSMRGLPVDVVSCCVALAYLTISGCRRAVSEQPISNS
jgi:hypothetical protein